MILLYYHLSDLQIAKEHSAQSLPAATIICIMVTLSSTVKHRKQSKVPCVQNQPCPKEVTVKILKKNNRMAAREVCANRLGKVMICIRKFLPHWLPSTLFTARQRSGAFPSIFTVLLDSCLSEELNSVAFYIKNSHFLTARVWIFLVALYILVLSKGS